MGAQLYIHAFYYLEQFREKFNDSTYIYQHLQNSMIV